MSERDYGRWSEDDVNRTVELYKEFTMAGINAACIGYREAAAEIRRLMAKGNKREPCFWKEYADGAWFTECGKKHHFTEGGPIENGFTYCPYCAKLIKGAPYIVPDDTPEAEEPKL